jgi:hypothetical protein
VDSILRRVEEWPLDVRPQGFGAILRKSLALRGTEEGKYLGRMSIPPPTPNGRGDLHDGRPLSALT